LGLLLFGDPTARSSNDTVPVGASLLPGHALRTGNKPGVVVIPVLGPRGRVRGRVRLTLVDPVIPSANWRWELLRCPKGKDAITGGAEVVGPDVGGRTATLKGSGPAGQDLSGWTAMAVSPAGHSLHLMAWCG
jgi:hypothetical protein